MLHLCHMHYSRRYGYLYVDTPKVACSTIKHTLHGAERGVATHEVSAECSNRYGYSDLLLRVHDLAASPLKQPTNATELDAILQTSPFVFCFVRNPYTRVLSAFIDKIERNASRRGVFLASLDKSKGDQVITFVEFLELVSKQPVETMDPHWRPQYWHVDQDGLSYHAIGSFERFSEDLPRILAQVSPALPPYVSIVDEHRTHAHRVMERYYNDDAERLVRMIYEQDFLRLGYSTDLAVAALPAHEPLVARARVRTAPSG